MPRSRLFVGEWRPTGLIISPVRDDSHVQGSSGQRSPLPRRRRDDMGTAVVLACALPAWRAASSIPAWRGGRTG